MAKRGKLLPPARIEDQESRPFRFKRYKQFFLIVCEDTITEPKYFNQFKSQIPAETIFLEAIGLGFAPLGIIEKAIEERDKLQKQTNREVDIVWAVFDKDDADRNTTTIKNFEAANRLAKKNNINLATSNEVFELWLLLHLCDVDASMPLSRREIYKKLETEIKKHPEFITYIYNHATDGGRVIEIISKIGSQEDAIERADSLLKKFHKAAFFDSNPMTRVHLLVKELSAWIVYYSYTPD